MQDPVAISDQGSKLRDFRGVTPVNNFSSQSLLLLEKDTASPDSGLSMIFVLIILRTFVAPWCTTPEVGKK